MPLSQALLADQARDDRWRQDIAALSSKLPTLAANLFFLLPRSQFDQAVAGLNASIPSMSDAEIVVGMASIVAMAGDAHTQISLTQAAAGFRHLPLTLAWFQDGLYVIGSEPQYQKALTAKVVQIGDKSVDEAYQLVSAVISHENDYWVRVISPSYLNTIEILSALKITSTALPVTWQFEDSRGNRFSLDIDYAPAAAQVSPVGFVPLYQRNTSLAYWATYLGDSRTLYFRYNQCKDDPSSPFSAFAARLFATFDANSVDHLVVDLRNNGGGSSSVLQPFENGIQQRQAQLGSPTKLYVLFNGSTFSSAMLNAQDFRNGHDQLIAAGSAQAADIKLLGEPTGGNPTVPWRNGAAFVLPNSGLVVDYTTTMVQTSYQPGFAVMPDIPLPLHSYEYFSGHDPVLAAVLADSNTPPPLDSNIAVISAAGPRQESAVSPSSLVSAFGDFSGAQAADAGGLPLPVALGGVQVLVNGAAAPLLATRSSQINFLVPPDASTGAASIRVVSPGSTLASGAFDIAVSAPGLFSADPLDPARPGAILNQDNTLNSQSAPAHSGDIVQIYATGVNLPPLVFLGITSIETTYSGPSGLYPGLWQINAVIPPATVVRYRGQVPLFVVSGTVASNGVTLWIQ